MEKSRNTRRALRVRRHLKAVTNRPRLAVYRTNVHIWTQLIGEGGKILASASSKSLQAKGTKTAQAQAVGAKIAQAALAQQIKAVAFDRGAYRYHGRIKALAEAARQGGLEF